MLEVILIIDESGAKGYSDKPEQAAGELGVMAGYMVQSECLAQVRNDLHNIASSFTANGKLHITDLPNEKQEDIRMTLFQFLADSRTPWLYESIYVQGLHENIEQTNSLSRQANKECKSNNRKSFKQEKELLHARLFAGVFAKAMALCKARIDPRVGNEIKITIISDRIDKATIKLFKQEADRLLNVGKPKIYFVSEFDVSNNKTKKSEFSIQTSAEKGGVPDLSGFQYEIKIEDSLLTLVADVLANSVHHYLQQMQLENLGTDLNHANAINDHPLSRLLFGAVTDNNKWFTDAFYPHPEQNQPESITTQP